MGRMRRIRAQYRSRVTRTGTRQGGVTSRSPDRHPTTRVALAVLAGLSLLLAYELVRAIGIASRLANEDTSIVWVAARDWMARRFRQPNYYGQSYGSTLEAIPIGVLHALGASYGFATSVVAATLEFAAWAALAWAAWHRGRRVMAALAFGIPLALAAYHTVYVTIELQVPGPRLLVVVACALLIALPTRPVALGCAVLLFGVGLQFDASSALLAAPAIAWYVVSYLRTRHQLFAVAGGAVLPVVQFVGTRLFYRRHPDYELHPSPSIRPSVNTLTGSAHHLSEFFGLYAPELWRSWIVPLAVLAFLVVLLLATRRLAYALPAAAVAVIVPYAMSTSRAEAQASLGPLLPRGRILLALPATLWFLTLLVAESGILGRVRASRGTRRALAAVCVVCATSTAVRAADFGGREGFWYGRSIALQAIGQYGFAPNSLMQRQCDDDVAFARRNAVGLIVYADQHAAYSCAAWAPSGITTLVHYERRTWVLYAELEHSRSGVLLVDHPGACALAAQRATCTERSRYTVLTFSRQPAVPLLASIGIGYRGFGPRCRPNVWFGACRRGGADLVRKPFAPGPANAEQARIAIVRAFGAMFEIAPDAATLRNVELGGRLRELAPALQRLGSGVAPAVTEVRFLDNHEATVRFRLRSGTLSGEAVVESGRWRVALPTFCNALPASGELDVSLVTKCFAAGTGAG